MGHHKVSALSGWVFTDFTFCNINKKLYHHANACYSSWCRVKSQANQFSKQGKSYARVFKAQLTAHSPNVCRWRFYHLGTNQEQFSAILLIDMAKTIRSIRKIPKSEELWTKDFSLTWERWVSVLATIFRYFSQIRQKLPADPEKFMKLEKLLKTLKPF